MSEQGTKAPPVDINSQPVSPPVYTNIFMGALLETIGFYARHMQVLVDDGYDAVDTVLYCRLNGIHGWCELKVKMPESQGGLTSNENKIKCLRALYLIFIGCQ